LTEGEALRTAQTAIEGLELAYAANENDEFVKATRISDIAKVQDGDSVVFMNFRADRAREITRAFVEKDFAGFERKVV
ncbi:2,3-bisphosphoglycerate-independent phosphoglycerate mutase, partial [Acinetobacter johnsonii]